MSKLFVRFAWVPVWPLAALVSLLAFNFFFTNGFFHIELKQGHLYGSLIDIMDRAAPVMLLSLGMTLVIATGGVDLSVGAVMAIAGSIAAQSLAEEYGFFVALALPLVVGAALGIWNGTLVACFGIQPIVATLILMVAGRGIAQLISDGQIIPIGDERFKLLGSGHFALLPLSLSAVLVIALSLAALVRRTALALFIESTGNNEVAAWLAGVPTRRVKLFAYATSGFCAAVAGLFYTADIQAADANNAGLYLELDAILAVVLGGTSLAGGRFSLLGSIIGALVLQTLTTTILTRGVPPEFTLVVKAIVVLAVCLLQSEATRQLVWRRRSAV